MNRLRARISNHPQLDLVINANAVLTYYLFALCWPLSVVPSWFALTAMGLFSLMSLLVTGGVRKDVRIGAMALIGLVVFASGAFAMVHHGDRLNLEVLNPLAAVGIAAAFSRVAAWHFRIGLAVILSAVIALMAFGSHIDDSVVAIGQNGITLHLLILYVAYWLRCIAAQRAPLSRLALAENYMFVLLLFTVSVWSQSRAATLAFVVLFAMSGWLLFRVASGPMRGLLCFLSALVLYLNFTNPPLMGGVHYSALDRLVLTVLPGADVGAIARAERGRHGFLRQTEADEAGGDRSRALDVRYRLAVGYFSTMDGLEVLFGNRTTNCHEILNGYSKHWCNIHNSVLQVHQVYGLLAVVGLAWGAWLILNRLWRFPSRASMVVLFAVGLKVMVDGQFFTAPSVAIFFLLVWHHLSIDDGTIEPPAVAS